MSNSEELVFDWLPVDEASVLGKIARPMALIEIMTKSGEWKKFYAELDSGAPMSVFNASDCEYLGYQPGEGKRFDLKGALGGSYPAYLHTMQMRIGHLLFNARIAFTEGKNHKQLLGRADVFDVFRVCLRGSVLKTSLTKEE